MAYHGGPCPPFKKGVEVIPEMSSILWGGYYGSHYRVRLCPPFGYGMLYKDYTLTRLNDKKTLLKWEYGLLFQKCLADSYPKTDMAQHHTQNPD